MQTTAADGNRLEDVGSRRSPRASRANFCMHGEIAAMAGMCAPTVMAKKVCQSLKDQTLSLRCGLVEQAMACVSSRLRRHGGNLAVLLPHLRLSFHTHHLTHLLPSSLTLKEIVLSLSGIQREMGGKMCRCCGVMRNKEPKLTRGEASHTVGAPPKQPHASYSFPLPRCTVGYMELLGISDCNVNVMCVLEAV
jgi:hypothetical protein